VAALDWDASDPAGRKRIMPVPYRRLAVAGVLTAAVVAVPVATFASGSGLPGAKPAHSSTTLQAKRAKTEATKPAPSSTTLKAKRAKAEATKSAATSQMHALASSAGISVSRFDAGLVAAKRAGGSSAAGVAAFARAAGVSPATAQRIVYAVFGKGKQVDHSLTGPSAVAALATRLGVSTSAARHALQQIGALSGAHGVDPASTAFAAIARQLGVSPAQLAGALDGVKKSMAGR
jgi:AraC-like DNA-binding protein